MQRHVTRGDLRRHIRHSYYVVGEGVHTLDADGNPVVLQPSAAAELRMFRFSRMGPKGVQSDPALNQELAQAMTSADPDPDSGPGDASVPAGFTYVGQFVDHDLTLDRTAVALGSDVTVDELIQGRSPALDLDSLYGRGPGNHDDRHFYAADGIKLKTGTTVAVPIDPGTNLNRDGFDLPRVGTGATKAAERAPLIPDPRNDENLAVAQTHLAFIHLHNKIVDRLASQSVPSALLFSRAREEVVRHYQWMLRTDFLPRIVDPQIVNDVFTNGRQHFEVLDTVSDEGARRLGHVPAGSPPTMPIEFSIAAYRLGHSMARDSYNWNRVFNVNGPLKIASLFQLFTFTGTSGILTPTANPADLDDPNGGVLLRLPTNWIIDWRRLHDFAPLARPELLPPAPGLNVAKRIDTLLTNPLAKLPAGTFGGREAHLAQDDVQRNLAFRNLTRANMVDLASGQQMAELLGATPLSEAELLTGNGGANLGALNDQQKSALVAHTPLWFYILREAEVNGGKLGPVGGRIVVEVFHRAMEGSRPSIVTDPTWRPTLGPDPNTFRMIDLLATAFDGKIDGLNPLGD